LDALIQRVDEMKLYHQETRGIVDQLRLDMARLTEKVRLAAAIGAIIGAGFASIVAQVLVRLGS
jgi:hypothetical protein